MADGDVTYELELDTSTALYRHWDADGKLLYVGISLSPTYRLSQHRDAAHWFRRIARVTVEWLPTREAALVAELAAIKAEGPECNIVHKRSTHTDLLERLADESRAELNRKVAKFESTYPINQASKIVGIPVYSMRLALLHGDLPYFTYGQVGVVISGWALIAYIEGLQAGHVSVRARLRNEDGSYPSGPSLEEIVSARARGTTAAAPPEPDAPHR